MKYMYNQKLLKLFAIFAALELRCLGVFLQMKVTAHVILRMLFMYMYIRPLDKSVTD